MSDREKFATLRLVRRVWAIASIHGESGRLIALHDKLTRHIQATDRVVYLGNYLGVGPDVRGTVGEMVEFRRWLLARPGAFAADVAFLRGAQEEMWSKLLQLQFAPNPGEVLRWLIDHGVSATIEAYGGDPAHGLAAAREGAVALTRWTGALRSAMAAQPGHQPFTSALRRAAFTDDRRLLFVHAGIDVGRPLAAQSDSFWWAAASFARIDAPYDGFRRVIRGFDPARGGLTESPHTLSIDAGCGFGGPLLAVCLDGDGAVVDSVES